METRDIAILGQEGFKVSLPYAEGHVCTAAEALALNQTRRENLSNNFRKRVKLALDGGEGAEPIDKIIADFAEADANYQFTLANVGTSRVLDPVEREARSLARAEIKSALAAQGNKLSDADDDWLESEIERIASLDEVRKVAQNIVKSRQKTAGVAISGFKFKAAEPAAE